MKKFSIISLIVLTIFGTYFYIPSKIAFVQKVYAVDEFYKNISSCDGIESISSFIQGAVPDDIGYGGLKVLDGGKKLRLTIKNQLFDFDFISSANYNGGSLNYKNITNSVETKLSLGGHYASITNKDNGYVSETDAGNLGVYGEFIKAMQAQAAVGGEPGDVSIPLKLERCQLFNPSKPIGDTSDPNKIIHMVSSSSTNLASKPKINIPGSVTNELGDEKAVRPAMELLLSSVIYPEGSTGRVVFYFTYNGSEIRLKNIAIKVFTDYSATAVNFGDILEPNDDSDATSYFPVASYTKVIIPESDIRSTLFNFAFNQKKEDGTCCVLIGPDTESKLSNWSPSEVPGSSFLNVSNEGWLAKWGVIRTKSSFANSADPLTTDPNGKRTDNSGCSLFLIRNPLLYGLCGIAILVRGVAKSMMCASQKYLKESLSFVDVSVGNSNSACDSESDSTTPFFMK